MLAAPASANRHYLEIADVTKRFGATVVLGDLSLDVAQGELISLLGPSGCGKTTLLRLIAGLLAPDSGTISVSGRDLTRVAAHRRNIGIVFQNYALFPHLSVADNVAFGLRAHGVPKAEIEDRVRAALALVRMEGFAGRAVSALSGGQQQRIAVARAIVVKPSLLLLDEPFSALDRKLRETMQIEMRHLLRDLRITSLFVTHDQDEALVISDRIAVMNEGRIEHLGSPGEVYARPKTLYVMEFIGQSTRIAGRVASGAHGTVSIETPLGRVSAPGTYPSGTAVVVGVRPETILLGDGGEAGFNHIRATLQDVVFFGSKTILILAGAAPGDRILVELARRPPSLAVGADVTVGWHIDDTLVFPAS
jgi:putative spermidine/putrescine transport system ATP-binding protein